MQKRSYEYFENYNKNRSFQNAFLKMLDFKKFSKYNLSGDE